MLICLSLALIAGLVQRVQHIFHKGRVRNAHHRRVFQYGKALVGDEEQAHRVPDEIAVGGLIQQRRHPHQRQHDALFHQSLVAGLGVQRSGLALCRLVPDGRHQPAGDVVQRHEADQNFERHIPASQRLSDGGAGRGQHRQHRVFHLCQIHRIPPFVDSDAERPL